MCYGSLAAICSYNVYLIWSKKNKYIFLLTFGCYYSALCCWIIDNAFCHHFQQLNLHAFWHLGAGYGSYLWVVGTVVERGLYLKKQVNIENQCESLGAHYVKFYDV